MKPHDPAPDAVEIPAEEVEKWCTLWKINDAAYGEYVISCSYVSQYLMNFDRIIFHGAAMLWKGKAYIFTAPSGTGKTTQIKHWIELYGNEIQIINGDKPILKICDNGQIIVYPSPWKGKEGMGNDCLCAPLGGIIMLSQAKENSIDQIMPSRSAGVLMGRLYSSFQNVDDIHTGARLLESILAVTPVWHLKNKGDAESAILTHDVILGKEPL